MLQLQESIMAVHEHLGDQQACIYRLQTVALTSKVGFLHNSLGPKSCFIVGGMHHTNTDKKVPQLVWGGCVLLKNILGVYDAVQMQIMATCIQLWLTLEFQWASTGTREGDTHSTHW